MFVDNPRGSVQLAATMVEEAIEVFVSGAKERQASLESSWHDHEADTEVLRTALRGYRAFWESMQTLSSAS
jgi:hypothetical protein